MIKGVSKLAIEISESECEYFEKVLFFIKPEFASLSEGTLKERANLIAKNTYPLPAVKVKKQRLFSFIKLFFSFCLGSSLTALSFYLL